VVTGLNEGVLPESVNAHAYLPDALRARLGLLDNETRYARDAYQLTALIHSSAELKVIAGRRTVRGDPLRPSRLIFAVEGAALAERVRRFYGGETAAAAGREDSRAAPGDSGFRLPPEPELVVASPIDRLSVSRFGAVLTNPYLFALETVLGLRSLDDEATELDGLGFGNLAHQVLERFGNLQELAESSDPERIARGLDGILDQLMDARFGADALPAVRFQGEQLRARLHAFARWQARWTAAGWRIAGAECTTPEGGVPLIVDGEPFPVTGRIDRIDHNPGTGEWAIFDYKTGDAGEPPDRTHRSGRGAEREWKDLQLPLYRHILPHVRDPEGRHPFTGRNADDALLGYILLPRDAGSVGESFADWSREDLAEADEAAADVVRMLRAGRFVHDPEAGPPPRDRRLAALLGLGYLESALETDDGETDDE
jgi:ATP-dependent helicase/nuclease subunit B